MDVNRMTIFLGDLMSNETAPAMDYDSHERTYEGFINFSKVGTIAALNIVLCLILLSFGGTTAVVFGALMVLATIAASGIGIALGANGWVPPAVIFVLTGVLCILTV